jgi:hypothetical protein
MAKKKDDGDGADSEGSGDSDAPPTIHDDDEFDPPMEMRENGTRYNKRMNTKPNVNPTKRGAGLRAQADAIGGRD